MTYPHQEWLESACSTDADRKHLQKVLRHGGRVFGTTGHILVAIPDDGRPAEKWPGKPPLGLSPLDAPLGPGTTFSVGTLREWAGPIANPCNRCNEVELTACRRCVGEGTVRCECGCGDWHDAECQTCGGSGKSRPRCWACRDSRHLNEDSLDRLGTWSGAVFNRRKLARLLALAPEGEVQVMPPYTPHGSAIVLRGEGWDGIVMPLRDVARLDRAEREPMEALALEAA